MQNTEPRPPAGDSQLFYCGCLNCRQIDKLWCSRATWFRHSPERESQIQDGRIPPPDPSYAIPRKRARADGKQGQIASDLPGSSKRRRTQAPARNVTPPPPPAFSEDTLHGTELDGGEPLQNEANVSDSYLGPCRRAQADDACPQWDGERLNAAGSVSRDEASLVDLLLDLSESPIAELQPEAPPPPEPPVQEPAPLPSRPVPPLTGIPQIDAAQIFVNMLRDNPRLEDSLLSDDAIRQLREPVTELATITPDERLAIRMYLADSQGSDEIYTANRSAVLERHPDDEILTLHLVKKKIAQLTGVYALSHDMCPGSCMAYTGPWAALEECRYCPEPRYETVVVKKKMVKKARRQFDTYPAGPQIQARYRSPEGAADMQYRQGRMPTIWEELRRAGELDFISDIIDGADFWDACQHNRISENDTCL